MNLCNFQYPKNCERAHCVPTKIPGLYDKFTKSHNGSMIVASRGDKNGVDLFMVDVFLGKMKNIAFIATDNKVTDVSFS